MIDIFFVRVIESEIAYRKWNNVFGSIQFSPYGLSLFASCGYDITKVNGCQVWNNTDGRN
jgi:hypothetical protein